MTEKQIARKLKKIDALKTFLKKERAKFGGYFDNGGKRYIIGDLYFEIGDYRKTNLYLNWFNKNFPDDITYVYFQLQSAHTYFHVKKLKEAHRAIVKLECLNIYFVDLLLGKDIKSQDIKIHSKSDTMVWAQENLDEYAENLTDDFLDWLKKISQSPDYQKMKITYHSILKSINADEERDLRSELFHAKYECEEKWLEMGL